VSAQQVSLEHMASVVESRGMPPRVVVAGNFATPWPAVAALDRALPEWTLHMLNPQIGAVPRRAGVLLETCFVGPGMRDQPTLSYVPSRLSMVPLLLRSTLPPDVVVLPTTPPRGGSVSLGTEVNILPAALEAARARGGLVVAAVNTHMPWTFGDAVISLDLVDLVVELDEPLQSAPPSVFDEAAHQIGARVSARVTDGATLQAGIGQVPDAALLGLHDRTGLGIWAEMISDGVHGLERSGALDPGRPIVASFMFGSEELYRWADGNERIRMLRTETVNDPAHISANPLMVSINSALEVDLFAQANASSVHTRTYSGFGGQPDFVVGALHSRGGQAMIALRSWHPRAGCSTIVPMLSGPATSFQHTAVVTEQGTALLWGRDQGAQAGELIEHAADPRARDGLREHAVGRRIT
jgi:acyl-CoA hydrolase